MILGIKEEMRKTSEHFSKVTELKDMGKREAELHYKEQYNERNKQFEKEIGNIREQYEHLIESKTQELQRFLDDASKYTVEKK